MTLYSSWDGTYKIVYKKGIVIKTQCFYASKTFFKTVIQKQYLWKHQVRGSKFKKIQTSSRTADGSLWYCTDMTPKGCSTHIWVTAHDRPIIWTYFRNSTCARVYEAWKFLYSSSHWSHIFAYVRSILQELWNNRLVVCTVFGKRDGEFILPVKIDIPGQNCLQR